MILPYIDCGVTDTPAHISDHKATYLIIPFHYDIQNAYTRLVWLYKRANFELLKQTITNYDWNCLSEGSLDEVCAKFMSGFFCLFFFLFLFSYGETLYIFKKCSR